MASLRQRGSVCLFAANLRGEYGATTEVEISAVTVMNGSQPCYGFAMRDVGMRLPPAPRGNSHGGGPRAPLRSVEQLTELIGRVPLKDLVREATDVIERLCIEAALNLTSDDRASAAEMLGLRRRSLYVTLRRYGLGDSGAALGERGRRRMPQDRTIQVAWRPSPSAPAPAAVLELLKPVTWFPPVWAFGCGVVSSGAPLAERWPLALAGLLLAGPMDCGMSQAVNDWFDRHVNAANEPGRLIPPGRVPGRWGLWIAFGWTVLSLPLELSLGPCAAGATLVGVAPARASAPRLCG